MEAFLWDFAWVRALLIRIPGIHVPFQVLAVSCLFWLSVLVHHSLFLYVRLASFWVVSFLCSVSAGVLLIRIPRPRVLSGFGAWGLVAVVSDSEGVLLMRLPRLRAPSGFCSWGLGLVDANWAGALVIRVPRPRVLCGFRAWGLVPVRVDWAGVPLMHRLRPRVLSGWGLLPIGVCWEGALLLRLAGFAGLSDFRAWVLGWVWVDRDGALSCGLLVLHVPFRGGCPFVQLSLVPGSVGDHVLACWT